MKPMGILSEIRWWFRKNLYHPVFNWYVNHFNWVPMEGQVFVFTDLVCVKWNGEHNKSTSTILKSEHPKLYRKFNDIKHGSVIHCEYIWGVDGRLRNVRRIKIVLCGEDILNYCNESSNHSSLLSGDILFYQDQIKTFNNLKE